MTAAPAIFDTVTTLATDVQGLPALVDRAARALMGARSSAEILEAKELAEIAYDVAKRTARIATAKRAHDSLVAAAHRAQADALEIESGAKRRLADEYDAAQERGEVAGPGGERSGREHSPPPATTSDIGFTRKAIHEARQIRDAEELAPGIVRNTLQEMLTNGEEPTRTALRREIQQEIAPPQKHKRSSPHVGIRDQHRTLLRAWKQAHPEARERFLRNIGAQITPAAPVHEPAGEAA